MYYVIMIYDGIYQTEGWRVLMILEHKEYAYDIHERIATTGFYGSHHVRIVEISGPDDLGFYGPKHIYDEPEDIKRETESILAPRWPGFGPE